MAGKPGAQTARRALDLLVSLVDAAEPQSLDELAQHTGIQYSAAYRLLKMLEEQEFVLRDSDKRYSAGSALITLAAKILRQLDVRNAATDTLATIAEQTNETVTLHVRRHQRRICVDGVESRQAVRRVVQLGENLALYAGPTGKVILAFVSEAERRAILHQAGEVGEDLEFIGTQLDEVRQKGYLATLSDRTAGVGGLSVPIFHPTGVVGAITVSGPESRWHRKHMEAYGSTLVEHAAAVSTALAGQMPAFGAAQLAT
ncbi:IclR family transcriptional regulator [Actinophytocola sp.]|uniref:IclR family transcriptional regulator n=1 Tax=Actinophytocola sp. TaxID=1872138 RepID=UPI003D6BD9FF